MSPFALVMKALGQDMMAASAALAAICWIGGSVAHRLGDEDISAKLLPLTTKALMIVGGPGLILWIAGLIGAAAKF